MKILLLILFGAFFFNTSRAQTNYLEGTEFWLGYMGNMAGAHSVLSLTSRAGAQGVVKIPLSGYAVTFNIPPNGSVELELPENITQTRLEGIFPFGVQVTSDNPINVVLMNRTGGSDDATMVKPLPALGYEYLISTYFESGGNPATFIIVATADDTKIEVSFPSGMDSIIFMRSGELCQFNSKSELTGTRVTVLCGSDGVKHPVAVFSGSQFTSVLASALDHVVSQMQPINTWGKSFNLFPFPYNDEYVITIVASEDQTEVNILSSLNYTAINHTQKLNRGEFYKRTLDHFGHISSNKPISVQIFTPGAEYNKQSNLDGDPFMVDISPDDQGITETRFYSFDLLVPGYSNLQKLNVVTEKSNIGNIKLNGSAINSYFTINPKNTLYAIAEITLPDGNANHLLTSSGGTFIAYPSAQLHARSYAYCIGHNVPFNTWEFDIGYLQDTLNYKIFSDTICSCENVWFETDGVGSGNSAYWDFGDGTSAFGNRVLHTFGLNGIYEVTLFDRDDTGCKVVVAKKLNLVVQNCDITVEPFQTICPGDSVTLTSIRGTSFLWSTGDSTRSIVVRPTETTVYDLRVDGGTTAICDSVVVNVHTMVKKSIGDSVHFCSNVKNVLSPGQKGIYKWSTGDISPSIEVDETGIYTYDLISPEGCHFKDTITVFMHDPPSWRLNNYFDPCLLDSFILTSTLSLAGTEDLLWSTGEKKSAISTKESAYYWLTIDNGICISSDTTYLDFSCFVVYIPKAFTPNNDNINDIYLPKGEGITEFQMVIYNRWGEEIFISNDITYGWDGRSKAGRSSPQGVYTYAIRLIDMKGKTHVFRNSFSLIK